MDRDRGTRFRKARSGDETASELSINRYAAESLGDVLRLQNITVAISAEGMAN
jgi:hypothetical protein